MTSRDVAKLEVMSTSFDVAVIHMINIHAQTHVCNSSPTLACSLIECHLRKNNINSYTCRSSMANTITC